MMEPFLEWSAASTVLAGQEVSGDRYLVCAIPDGMLIAVADGVGHGHEAAAAAQIAVETLERSAREPVVTQLKRCHEALRETRGVVMSLAVIREREHTLTWAGVGNVEGVVLRAARGLPRETLLLRSGVLGAQLPPLQTTTLSIGAGDLLAFVTDGVGNDFLQSVSLEGSLQASADRVLARHGKRTDDALVLIARVRS